MPNLKKLIREGELAREKDQNEKALLLLDRAIFSAISNKNYNSVLSALSHRLLVWKHAYLRTKDEVFLELMLADAKAGLRIAKSRKVDSGFIAIMQERIGHYYEYKKNFKRAKHELAYGLKFIDKKNLGKYSEYLGHYGLALGFTGNKKGLLLLKQALKLIEKTKNLRSFHKLVIHSGILLRLALVLEKFGKKQEASEMLNAATIIAQIIAKKYKMPHRLYQAQEIKKKKLKVF